MLWFISIASLYQAIDRGVTAEESTYNPNLTASDRLAIQHMSRIADGWATLGWILQFAAAATLPFGIRARRLLRRIFLSLAILIAADGITLLLTVIIIAH